MPLLSSLLLILLSIVETLSVPLNNRPRSSSNVINVSTDSFDTRRRDLPINFYDSNPVIFPNNGSHKLGSRAPGESYSSTMDSSVKGINASAEISRRHLLLPDLDMTGNPRCLSDPDDTFCESVANYPKAAVKHDIEYSPVQFLELFGNKDIDGRKSYHDDDLSEERVCRRISKIIYPQMAKNQANQWVYVVNEVEYTQAVVAEICEREGKPCAYLDNNLPPGMFSRCKQKFSYKRLLALHPTEKRTYADTFKFPSCCACYVKSPNLARNLELKGRTKNN